MVKDTYTGPSSTSSSSYGPAHLTAVGNTLYFSGHDSTNGRSLWKSDGTTAGTVMVKDTDTSISSSSNGLYYLTAVGNTVYL